MKTHRRYIKPNAKTNPRYSEYHVKILIDSGIKIWKKALKVIFKRN